MNFNGRVYFDFLGADVWRFFQLLLRAQQEGARPGLEWKPVLLGGLPDGELVGHARLLAASEVVRQDAVMSHGAFVAAALTGVHREGIDVADPDLIAVAAKVAELDADFLADDVIDGPGRRLLTASHEEAMALGVDAVPSVYRHGPVVAVRTTTAVTFGEATPRLELISAMLNDDGIWELRKP